MFTLVAKTHITKLTIAIIKFVTILNSIAISLVKMESIQAMIRLVSLAQTW